MSSPADTSNPLTPELLDACFLNGSPESFESYRAAIEMAKDELAEHFGRRPYSGAGPETLAATLNEEEVCPEDGADLAGALRAVGEKVVHNSVRVTHPACVAHLQCPPLIPALAAEEIISATNQSLDSWDQSPAATMMERRVIRWLDELFALGDESDGVFTGGGTQSNFMGLLLARDRYARDQLGWPVGENGLPPEGSRFRILCSEAAHFTVRQSAALLGLGEQAVAPVGTDNDHRMNPAKLDRKLEELRERGLLPVALVGTAGSTDFGSIDPLSELAVRAGERGMWFHVDAAYGGALALSEKHRGKLEGIERADSIAVDFHKQFYQPVSCAAFLLRSGADFGLMQTHADYLNPESDEASGVPNLVGKSVQTSRRFDALKLFVSMRTLGRKNLAAMIEHTIELASQTADLIAGEPALELANRPQMGALVFRYRPGGAAEKRADEINEAIWNGVIQSGEAMLARTRTEAGSHLKLTLLNPRTTIEDIQKVLKLVKETGQRLEGAR